MHGPHFVPGGGVNIAVGGNCVAVKLLRLVLSAKTASIFKGFMSMVVAASLFYSLFFLFAGTLIYCLLKQRNTFAVFCFYSKTICWFWIQLVFLKRLMFRCLMADRSIIGKMNYKKRVQTTSLRTHRIIRLHNWLKGFLFRCLPFFNQPYIGCVWIIMVDLVDISAFAAISKTSPRKQWFFPFGVKVKFSACFL